MNNCTVDIYADIKHCTGQVNMPGTRNKCLMIRRENIVTFPTPAESDMSGATLAMVATCEGDFTLAADAGWVEIDLVPDVNSFTSEAQGSWGSKTFLNTFTGVIPGVGKEATGFCRMVNNDDVVFLVPNREGVYRLFGNDAFQVEVTPKQESGAAATDSAQTTIEVKVTDVCPAPFYDGKIELLSDVAKA